MRNVTTTQTTAAQPVWMVATTWEVEPELVEAKQDSDGRWLKVNCKLETPVIAFSETKVALAGRSDYDDAEMLFSARR